MFEHLNSWKNKNEQILTNITSSQKSVNLLKEKEKSDLKKLLQPLKDKIDEMKLTKGPISLISSILELFYEKKKAILLKEEIEEEIKNKLKNIRISMTEGIYIYELNNQNFYLRINDILIFNKCFERHPLNNKEYIILNIKTTSENLSDIITELIEQYNKLTYNGKISVEIEEYIGNKFYYNFENNKVNNYENGLKFCQPYDKTERTERKRIIKDLEYETPNYSDNINDIKEIKQKVKSNLKNSIINNTKNKIQKEIKNTNSNINTNNIIKKPEPIKKDIENKDHETLKESIIKIPKETSDINTEENKINNINNNNNNSNINLNAEIINKKPKKKIKKHFLQKKRNNSFKLPVKNNNIKKEENEIKKEDKEVNTDKEIIDNKQKFNSSLSMYSVAFSCLPKKKEKFLLNQIIDYVSSASLKLISIFGSENIKEREEKKIKELKLEIYKKNREIQYHQYIIDSLEDPSSNENYIITNNRNSNLMNIELITKDIQKDYIKLSDEVEVLYAYQFILNKMNKNKKGIDENIKINFKNCFDLCMELFKKIQENKKKYLSNIENICDYIKTINSFDINARYYNGEKNEINTNKQNMLIFKEEKEIIEKIEQSLISFEDLIMKKIYKCLLNTPYEYMFREMNFDNPTYNSININKS